MVESSTNLHEQDHSRLNKVNQHKQSAVLLSRALGDGSKAYQRQIKIVSASNNEALLHELGSNAPAKYVLASEQQSQSLSQIPQIQDH